MYMLILQQYEHAKLLAHELTLFPWHGRADLSRDLGASTQFRRREGWVPHREGKNHGCRKSFPGVRLSFCPTNLGALITLPTQAHHEELIGAAGSYRFEP
jgi:hypothetical protein